MTDPENARSRRRKEHPRANGRAAAPTSVAVRATDAEVVAALLDPASPQRALGVAESLVAEGFRRLRAQRLEHRLRVSNVAEESAQRLVMALELGRRVFADHEPAFDSPEVVYCHNRDLARHRREHFAVVLLNARHRYIRRELVSIGSLNASIVHPREVFRPAIRAAAAAIVLVHNHPSGDPAPSRDDIEITRRLVRVGEVVGIDVLDHVIVAGGGYCSFRRERLL